jgi:branched-chain amino acid transport system permease protein
MNRLTIIMLTAAVVVLALVPLAGSTYLLYLATQIIIFVLFATSLNLLVGYGGLISFGHAAFFAIGGYSSAIVIERCIACPNNVAPVG